MTISTREDSIIPTKQGVAKQKSKRKECEEHKEKNKEETALKKSFIFSFSRRFLAGLAV